jgi:hypothetical protein
MMVANRLTISRPLGRSPKAPSAASTLTDHRVLATPRRFAPRSRSLRGRLAA